MWHAHFSGTWTFRTPEKERSWSSRSWSGPLRCIAEDTHHGANRAALHALPFFPCEERKASRRRRRNMHHGQNSHADVHVGLLPPDLPHGLPHEGFFFSRSLSRPTENFTRTVCCPSPLFFFTLALHADCTSSIFLHRVAEWVNPLDVPSRRLRSVILALGSW